MDDGEVELSGLPYLDEFLKNSRKCTHTHTCNPSGPDTTRTHTRYHTHTQVLSSEEDQQSNKEHSISKPRRALGNREAVRKYREKKKAQTAYLEVEVKKLGLFNQQLIRKLQEQAILEAGILRLRGLLLELRGKIDNDVGEFPFQKQCNSAAACIREGGYMVQPARGDVGLRCETDLLCFHPHLEILSPANIGGNVPWDRNCQPPTTDCRADTNSMAIEGHSLDVIDTTISSAHRAE